MHILGVEISEISRSEALKKVEFFFESDSLHRVYTPNPEMLVDASKDAYFRDVLNAADLTLCDGMGLKLLLGRKVERVAGVDFMSDMCELAARTGKTVYLLGSGDRVVLRKAAVALQTKFPNLQIVGMHPGPEIQAEKQGDRVALKIDKDENNELIGEIVMAAPDILFVGFGHGKQEKWIDEYAESLPSVRVAMGVGGAFDYISGSVPRAPRVMRSLGLEWLFRLLMQPKRFTRIFKAVIIFPLCYLKKQ